MPKKKLNLSDLIDIEFLQEFQDSFALASDIASVIIDESGHITKPSNFTNFCLKYSKINDSKDQECNACNIKWQELVTNADVPVIYNCKFGLTDFAVPIIVDGQHIASILSGQVFTKKLDEKNFRKIARQMGIDEDKYIKVLRKIKIVTPEQIKVTTDLLRNMADSISKIATKNLELIRKNEREVLLKRVIESVRSSLDIEKTLRIACYVLAKSFDIERVVVVEFYNKKNLQDFYIRKEYKANENIKSPQDEEGYKEVGEFAGMRFLKSSKPLVIDNIAESEYPEFFKNYYKAMGVKSLLWFPIMLKGQLWGTFTLSNLTSYKHWSDEDINIIQDISNQISIAINQAQLYMKEKETTERELLLREAVQIFRSTNDSTIIKKYFVEITANYFGADRCLFCDYDRETEKFLPFGIEKLKSSDIKSLLGFDVETNTPEFVKRQQKRKNVIIRDLEKTLSKVSKSSKKYKALLSMQKYGVKSDYGFLVEYKGTFMGVLIMHFVKEKRILTTKEMEFLKVLKNQAGIALYNAELFKENIQVAENEKVLRQIMLSLTRTFDFQKIIIAIVTEAGKFFKADRCFYVEIDPNTTSNRPIKDWAEYLSSPQIMSHLSVHPGKGETEIFIKQTLNKKIVLCSDTGKEDLPKETKKMLIDKLSVKSYFILPVCSGNFVYGSLVFHYVNNFKTFTKNDLYMSEAIVNQVSIAINQSGLYQKQKHNAEKEKLLRDVSDVVRNSINIAEIETKFVTEIGKRFKADRVFISRFNSETNTFLPVSKTSEYLSGSDVKSIANIEVDKIKGYSDIFRSKQIINFSDYKEFIKEYKGKIDENFLYEYDIKSGFALPLSYMDKIYGIIIMQYTKENHVFDEDEISLIKILADQVGAALSQAELFKENKQVAENERALRQIMLSSVATFKYEQIVKTIVKQAGEYFKADRCFYVGIDIETASNSPIKGWAEYLSSKNIKSHLSISPSKNTTGIFAQLTLQKKIVFCDDLEKEDIPEETKQMLRALSVKSYLFAPVYYGDMVYGAIVLHFVKDFKKFTQSDHYMIQAIANQSAIIINQSEIYKKQKNTAEREYLLRRITETIRLNLDINEIKQKIVNEIGKTFNADRCFLGVYDEKQKLFLKPDVEYLSSSNIKSLKNLEPYQEELKYFLELVKNKKTNLPIQITSQSILNIEDLALKKYFEKAGMGAHFFIPIWDKEKKLTFLVLQYIERTNSLEKEESKLLITLAKQIAIAFNQSNLYKQTKQQAEREKIAQNVTNIIRSSLEIDIVMRNICEELLKIFDVQRIFIGKIALEKREYYVEIVKNNEIVKFSDFEDDIFNLLSKYWKKEINKNKKIIVVNNVEKSDLPEAIKKVYIEAGVQSVICVPIKSKEEIWGAIFLSTINKMHNWTEDEKRFLESIVIQLDTGIRQAELYENQRKAANKERILKDIISEIKLTRDLHQAYDTLLKKLAQIFNLNRTLFLESSEINPEELNIKYEYVIKREDMATNNLIFPQVCIEEFLNLIHNLQPLILNDVSVCHPEETTEFFKKYKIQALLSFPLIKYNKEIKVLGFIVLCSENVRKWTDEEIELMKAISDSVVSVIWEIAKFIETEELRDSFVSTLAHDFQVPLIGERTALEYILNYSKTELGENREIIKEISENNQNIIELLNKSVNIYNYESGKKKLDLVSCKLNQILKEAILLSKGFADSKKIKINFEKSQESIFVEAEKRELLKVFHILIENAAKHSPEGKEIKIEYCKKNSRIIISIHNEGKPIPISIQEKIFNRYEMAQAIERKIGAGTGLFLAKKIIESHKGAIWFKTDKNIGTTFYVALPAI